jgi:hypothetical protein
MSHRDMETDGRKNRQADKSASAALKEKTPTARGRTSPLRRGEQQNVEAE